MLFISSMPFGTQFIEVMRPRSVGAAPAAEKELARRANVIVATVDVVVVAALGIVVGVAVGVARARVHSAITALAYFVYLCYK